MQEADHGVVKSMGLGPASLALNVVVPTCPWPGDVTQPLGAPVSSHKGRRPKTGHLGEDRGPSCAGTCAGA